jgi:DNA-binding MarR family transcriptional regulator
METTIKPTDVAARLRPAIVRLARRMRQDAMATAGGTQLSPTLSAALATVDDHGPLPPSELAERERVRRPTATRIVASLERLGLVTSTPDPADGRARLVAVTADGRELLRRLRRRKTAYLARRVGRLDDEELETLERAAGILERMLDFEAGTSPATRPFERRVGEARK